jgi:hypothetical protein
MTNYFMVAVLHTIPLLFSDFKRLKYYRKMLPTSDFNMNTDDRDNNGVIFKGIVRWCIKKSETSYEN